MFRVIPLVSNRLFSIYRLLAPVMLRLLPSVTPSNVPLSELRLGVASVLITVPPMMVPLNAPSPPALKMPALPTSSVPLLVSVPVRLMVPPLRESRPTPAVVIVPVSARVPPLTEKLPAVALLLQAPPRFRVPADRLTLPLDPMEKVPAVVVHVLLALPAVSSP